MKSIKLVLSLLIIQFSFGLNLKLHDYDNPSASHILDTHIMDDILIVVGMIGGIEIYDIAQNISEYSIAESVSGTTLTVNPDSNLSPGYTYVVHVFNDGQANVDDDFKTWWRFNTIVIE